MPDIEEIVLCKAVQIGGTEAMYNMMGWAIEQAPAPMMMVLPTGEIAVYVSRNRFAPMIEAVPSLASRKSPHVDEFNLLEMNFTGMVLSLAGANSAPSLATRPIRYLFFDETDRFPPFAGREGEPIGLATERTRTFWNRKIIKLSTPTTVTGNIWRAYQGCSLRYEYYVPCPHCGKMQTLTFWGEDKKQKEYHLRWHEAEEEYDIESVYENTWYECQECKGRILDHHKPNMLAMGEWIDQEGVRFEDHAGRSRSVGFHLNTLYSPWVSFGEMAVKFLKTKDAPAEFMNFVNLWLGMPVKETVLEHLSDDSDHLMAPYKAGIIPKQAITLISSVDVQKYYVQYVVRAWASDMESWLIREGVCASLEEYNETVLKGAYPIEGEAEIRMGIRLCLIDSGFNTDEVYDFVRLNPKICRATKGSSHPLRAPYSASRIDTYPDGKRMPEGVTLWLFDTIFWKDSLTRRIGLSAEGAGSVAQWHVYPEVTAAYLSQLSAEEKVIVRNRTTGKTQEVWQLREGRKRNEALDLEVMNLMGADMLGLKFYVVARAHGYGQENAARPSDVKPKPKVVLRSKWMTRGRR